MPSDSVDGGSRVFYRFHHYKIDFILVAVLFVVLGFLFIGVIGGALRAIGFSWYVSMIILFGSLLGSWLNIPVAKIYSSKDVTTSQNVEFFGIVFGVPAMTQVKNPTTIAINVGGALIPMAISIYLFFVAPSIIPAALVSIAVVSIIMYSVARPVKSIGIAAPALVAPAVAATCALILTSFYSTYPSYVAYVSGVLGTLIGADLLHLKDIFKGGPKIAAIGGAGTFDGIFLSGIIAAILA
jgi:uncharacterized membrane protein